MFSNFQRAMSTTLKSVAGTAMLFFLSSPAIAGIISTSGSLIEIAAPDSVLEGALESDSVSSIFAERQGVTLANDLDINIDAPGTFFGSTNPVATMLAGTRIDSYFLHIDPVGSPGFTTYSGSVTFDQDLLGLITFRTKLDDSDALLGLASVAYPTGQNSILRGVLDTTGRRDEITLSADRRTVNFDLQVSQGNVEQMRFLLASSNAAVPEPATFTLFLAMAGIVTRIRRRA